MRFSLVIKGTDFTSVAVIARLQSVWMRPFVVALFGLTVTLGLCLDVVAQANSSSSQIATVESSPPKSPGGDTRYRIGAGDVLSIIVRKAPELSGPARVDQRGMIRIPMIKEDVLAACHTESELAAQIANLYLVYKNNPSVEVFVTEFQSRPVAVIGAVNAAGQFRLQRQVRLNELVTFAGGPSTAAGRVIHLIHTGSSIVCPNNGSEAPAPRAYQGLEILKLNDTINGKEEANPFVQPGDIVQLPEADQVFVIGHVVQPRAIVLKDKIITVSWAIAMAGGAASDGKEDGIRIIREMENGGKQEILVDLKAIRKQKAQDVVLVPNDIVEVGRSTGKTILNILQGAVPGAISQGVIRVIP